MLNFIRALCLIFFFAVLAGCGSGVNILPEPFTRERADGKIPVKTELIRQQVRAELAGMPEGEAEVARWQKIETDYHSCRLSADKAKESEEKVFADCMANRGYVYMYPLDAEQLHNDIDFEITKERDERIVAERKAEEERIAAEKKRQEEEKRARQQKVLNTALVAELNRGKYVDFAEINRLINEGADINTKSKKGFTPLHYAAKEGETEFANTLIKAGADIDAKTNKGWTALHLSAGQGQIEIALALIKAGAGVNAKSNNGETPLHDAAYRGYTQIAPALIKAGADIDAKDNYGDTPLHVAVVWGWGTRTLDTLIKAGADIDAQNKYGTTPLHLATQQYEPEFALALIKAGANFSTQDGYGDTPLHMAVGQGKTEIVLAIISRGIYAPLNSQNNEGNTPLHIATRWYKTEIALALIKAGASGRAKNSDGQTPLYLAIVNGSTEIAHAIVKKNLFIKHKLKPLLDIAIQKHGKDSEIAHILREAMEVAVY